MSATTNILIIGVAIGWFLALRALAEVSTWGLLLGAAFLWLVAWSLVRASDI